MFLSALFRSILTVSTLGNSKLVRPFLLGAIFFNYLHVTVLFLSSKNLQDLALVIFVSWFISAMIQVIFVYYMWFASAVALPIISSIIAPSAAMAQSTPLVANYGFCVSPTVCQSRSCVFGTCCHPISLFNYGIGSQFCWPDTGGGGGAVNAARQCCSNLAGPAGVCSPGITRYICFNGPF